MCWRGYVRVYLDVSCLNRPFDDQDQVRIRIESEAVAVIFERLDSGEWEHVSSEMASIETDAISDKKRRVRVRQLFPPKKSILKLTQSVKDRAVELENIGFKAADGLHIAAAENASADVLLSCDDRLCRLASRVKLQLHVRVANPVAWLKEIDGA